MTKIKGVKNWYCPLEMQGNFGMRDVRCGFLVGSGWLVLFPRGLWMVTIISWWALNGYYYFPVGSGWSLLFPGGLWMVAVISWRALDGCCYFLVDSGWMW